MPLYFLNIYNRVGSALDEEGAELPDLDSARASAVTSIRSVLAEELREGVLDLRGRIEISDGRSVLAVVRFDEALTVHGDGTAS